MKLKSILLSLGLALMLFAGGYLWHEKASPSFSLAQAQESMVKPLNETTAYLQDEENTISVNDLYGPSVVAVNVEIQGQAVSAYDQIPPEFRQFFNLPQDMVPQNQTQHGAGSGFVIDNQGRIITNFHVVKDALDANTINLSEGSKLTVSFTDTPDTQVPVKVVGVNPSYDMALLELVTKADLPSGLKAIPLANSDELKVGQKVIAIGNPFGLQSTVTTGIVSALGRDMPSIGQFNIAMVQTDAAINPGNSGGPLLNSKGELVGINTAIIPSVDATGQRGFLGVGFAVPSNYLRDNLADLEKGGVHDVYSSKARLGAQIADVSSYPESVRSSLHLPDHGAMIVAVQDGSPAQKAGLKGSEFSVSINGQDVPAGGDVITQVNGTDITSTQQLQDLVFSMNPGDTVHLTVDSAGTVKQLDVKLEIVPLAATNQDSSPSGN
ncbi:MAG: trypsin-like peptidase domain-containing protein [Trueperaceae bacterium]|nr:trypsin-like peptidase domain-containing protein [Trueperaceae bacterium]